MVFDFWLQLATVFFRQDGTTLKKLGLFLGGWKKSPHGVFSSP